MLTKQEVLEKFESACLDGRDAYRLAAFLEADELEKIGFKLNEGAEWDEPEEWTRENILAQLKDDVAFGFEKALNCRGISSGLMCEVVKMWNRILQEGLEDFDTYSMYGLPVFKATAVKYGWPNPIGDDAGSEQKYAEDW